MRKRQGFSTESGACNPLLRHMREKGWCFS